MKCWLGRPETKIAKVKQIREMYNATLSHETNMSRQLHGIQSGSALWSCAPLCCPVASPVHSGDIYN